MNEHAKDWVLVIETKVKMIRTALVEGADYKKLRALVSETLVVIELAKKELQ